MLLSIVTLNYNKSHLTIACMESLYKQFPQEFKDNKIELIIVDNASSDDSVKQLHTEIKTKNYKGITIISNKTNDGFGTGSNIGAKEAKGKQILFLNNDTIIKDRSILDMASYLDTHDDVSILGGQLSNMDGKPQSSVGTFYTPFKVLLLLAGMQRFGGLDRNPTSIQQVDWVKGALLMVKREVFSKLKGFDEEIFMYTEDMELCYRARLAGFKVYFYPEVHVYHQDQGSSNRSFAIVNIYQNLLYFYKKHRPRAEYLFVKSLLRTKAVTLIGVGHITRNSYFVQTYEKALKAT